MNLKFELLNTLCDVLPGVQTGFDLDKNGNIGDAGDVSLCMTFTVIHLRLF